jgi:hypothetical protein
MATFRYGGWIGIAAGASVQSGLPEERCKPHHVDQAQDFICNHAHPHALLKPGERSSSFPFEMRHARGYFAVLDDRIWRFPT